MIQFLGKNYYIDFDEIESYINLLNHPSNSPEESSELKFNFIRFELIKTMLDAVLFATEQENEKLAMKINGSLNPQFAIAFNTLLNKKIIKSY